jgi:RES domain-containing protein
VLIGASLDAAILQLPSRPQRNTSFRAVRLAFASDPLGKRRPIVGGRFNIAGGARVLYLADDQITALHEAQAFGFPASSIAIVPVECNLHAVVDLRDPGAQALLHTNHLELSANFRSLAPGSPPSPTQLLGERVSASLRIDGLIYDSSARPGHTNLALIEAALKALGSFAAVNDPNNKLFDSLP